MRPGISFLTLYVALDFQALALILLPKKRGRRVLYGKRGLASNSGRIWYYLGWNVLTNKLCWQSLTPPCMESLWSWEGKTKDLVLCPFTLSVTLTLALSFSGLHFSIRDNFMPDRSFAYRVRCNDIFFSFFFFFWGGGGTPEAHGNSQARVLIGTAAAVLHHSHGNSRSERHLW